MKFNNILFISLATSFLSCGPSKKEIVSEMKLVDKTKNTNPISPDSQIAMDESSEYNDGDEFKLNSYLINVDVDTSDLQEISESVALLIYPTDDQIEAMKKEYGEEDFYTIADDAQWYQGTSIGLIDSLGVKTITAENRFIRFKGRDEKSVWTLDIRKEDAPPWNLIFFHKDKEPEIISTVDLDLEKLKVYFNL